MWLTCIFIDYHICTCACPVTKSTRRVKNEDLWLSRSVCLNMVWQFWSFTDPNNPSTSRVSPSTTSAKSKKTWAVKLEETWAGNRSQLTSVNPTYTLHELLSPVQNQRCNVWKLCSGPDEESTEEIHRGLPQTKHRRAREGRKGQRMNRIMVGWEPENGREQRAWTEDWTGRESNRTPEREKCDGKGGMDGRVASGLADAWHKQYSQNSSDPIHASSNPWHLVHSWWQISMCTWLAVYRNIWLQVMLLCQSPEWAYDGSWIESPHGWSSVIVPLMQESTMVCFQSIPTAHFSRPGCILLSEFAWYKLKVSDTFVHILLLVIPNIVEQECMLAR